jgi:hypothetical protein
MKIHTYKNPYLQKSIPTKIHTYKNPYLQKVVKSPHHDKQKAKSDKIKDNG